MALTTESSASEARSGGLFSTFEKLPVGAAAKIYLGAIVGLLNGYVVSLSAFPSAKPIGRAEGHPAGQAIPLGSTQGTVDNTSGAAGDLFVIVERGVFLMKNSASVEALAEANTGDVCYFVDDETVSNDSAKGLRPVVGTFLGFDEKTGKPWVQVGVGESGRIIATGAAGADLRTHQYGAVKLSAGAFVKCGDGERSFGILQNTPNTTETAIVCTYGPSLAKAGAGFTTDLAVASDANGLIVDCVNATLAANAAQTQTVITGDGAGNLGAADGAFEDQNNAVTGVDGTGSNAASKADVDARLVSIGNNMQELYAQLVLIKADVAGILANTSIIGDQALGVARETAAGGATKMIFVAPAGLI